MTETLQRPSSSSLPPRRAAGPRPKTPLSAGLPAASWAALLGLLALGMPVLLIWATDPRAAAGVVDAFRVVGQVWLVAHGASLEVGDGRFALAPLALCALPLLLLVRAGSRAARACGAVRLPQAARVVVGVAVPYAVLTTGVALVAGTGDVRPLVLSAALSGLVLALLGAGIGVLRPDRLWRTAWLRLPAPVRRVAPAVVGASAVLAACGALLVGGSLVAHLSRAADLAGATGPGPVGGVALLLLSVLYVPNAVVWGASWLAGPGFAVGVGTAVGPFGYDVGPVPALPLLAALPAGGIPTWVGVVVLAVPLAAGVVAGRLLGPRDSARSAVGDVLLAGLGCGLLWTVLAALAGGPTGGQRLTEVGPSPWWTGVAVGVEITVAAGATVFVLRRRRQSPA